MSKKFVVVIMLLVAMTLMFSACGAVEQSQEEVTAVSNISADPCLENGHDFTEASCTELQSCKVCGETQGELLEHDFADATCTEAKICKLCNASEGEALGHSFDKLQLSDSLMTRSCKVCGEVESRAFDAQFVVEQELPGIWEFEQMIITQGGQKKTVDAGLFDVNEYEAHMVINADGSVKKLVDSSWNSGPIIEYNYDNVPQERTETGILYFGLPEEVQVGYTEGAFWSLSDWEKAEDGSFSFYVDISVVEVPEDGTRVELRYADGKYRLFYTLGDTQTAILSKDHGETYAPMFMGEWSDGYYRYVFHEDRSFDYGFGENLFENIGNWLIRPLHDGKIVLVLMSDGNACPVVAHGIDSDEGISLEAYHYVGGRGLIYLGILRQYEGGFLNYFGRSFLTRESWYLSDFMDEEYFLSFTTESASAEFDGRFTSQLDEKISGYWKIDEINLEEYRAYVSGHLYSDESAGLQPVYTFKYNYNMLDLDDAHIYLNVTTIPDNDDEYEVTYSMIGERKMEQNRELVKEASTALLGEWKVKSYTSYNSKSRKWSDSENIEGEFSFTEDGHFKGVVDIEMTGTWEFSHVGSGLLYSLQCAEMQGTYITAEVFDDSLDLSILTQDKTYSLYLKREKA